jgi:glyceraldehyde-3-phosphate dehydrogenase (NAD(P))
MRIAVVGMGVIGKRLAAAVIQQRDMTLAGVAVRSVGVGVLAQRRLPYHAVSPEATEALRGFGIEPAGDLDDLLASADLVIDAGPGGTGAGRFPGYQRAGISSVFCGGETDTRLGPMVHPALNYARALGRRSIRLPSCNTTALGRLIAAARPGDVAAVEAIVLRCVTDTDKADKGITNGTVFDIRASHHGTDLESMVGGVRIRVRAAGVPSICGHVALVQLRLTRPVAETVADRIARSRRVVMLAPDQRHDTGQIKAQMYRTTPRGDRYELAVQLAVDDARTVTAWISLDNEAITVPEAVDVMRAVCAGRHEAEAEEVRDMTDAALLRPSTSTPDAKEDCVA